MDRYQDYVIKDGKFIGKFEEMYQKFDDPWHQSEDGYFDDLSRKVVAHFIRQYQITSSVEFGCGLGKTMNFIQKETNIDTLGIDISETSIKKAKEKYPDMSFEVNNIENILDYSKDAKLINNIYVDQLNDFDSDFSTNSDTGTGGFVTKIQAVKRAALSNTYTMIASGLEDNILNDIFEKDNVGTLFIPSSKKISAKKQWLDTTDNRGCVIIDDGAWNALSNNKSLLLVGVENVEGNFQKGDVIQCKNTSNECIAKGIVNYSSGDVMKMKGMTMNDIKNEYGDEFNKELIHIDNLIIIET